MPRSDIELPERLRSLNDRGFFKILALDHENTLRAILSEKCGCAMNSIQDDKLIDAKMHILETFKNYVSGTLLDPVCFERCQYLLPSTVGVLLKLEKTWKPSTLDNPERITVLNAEWTVERISRTRAAGIKLMIYYRPDSSKETRDGQRTIARLVGEWCAKYNVIYCLEPTGYALTTDERCKGYVGERALALNRPATVLESVMEFSKGEYRVDMFKLDFPADLKFTTEFSDGEFDGKAREPLYDLKTVEKWCSDISRLCNVPWTVMSSGASNAEFVEFVRLSVSNGGSGYICGQGIWREQLLVHLPSKKIRLEESAVRNIHRVNAAVYEAC